MTRSDFEKITELNEIIKKYQECKEYFEPTYRYSKSDIEKENKRRFPYNMNLKKKDQETAICHIDLFGWGGGKSIDVDIEFIEYCRVYFENKVKSLQAEIDSYFEKENTDND